MKDLMVDIETLGTSPRAIIIEVAVIEFDRNDPDFTPKPAYHSYPSIYLQKLVGMTVDKETIIWWEQQAKSGHPFANTIIHALENEEEVFRDVTAPDKVIQDLRGFFEDVDPGHNIYCKGASFDFPLLAAMSDAVGGGNLFRNCYSKQICCRSIEKDQLRMLRPEVGAKYKVQKKLAGHDALGDCSVQINNIHLGDRLIHEEYIVKV